MTSDVTPRTLEVASTLVELRRAEKLLEAGERVWDEYVMSIEPFQADLDWLQVQMSVGEKGAWWVGAQVIEPISVGAPT